jgi:death-on-curing protein
VTEPVWLSDETVIFINERVVAKTGEPFLLRNRVLLELAVAKPNNHYLYRSIEDVVSLATTLLFGVARNRPFEQGNKRTGFLSAVVFLELNGYAIDLADTDFLGRLVVAALEDRMSEDDFADILRLKTVELKDD